MPKIERMTVAFPGPVAAQIRAVVDAGEYATVSEVVRDAMRLWSMRQERRQSEIERLRQAWDEGKASGIAGPWDLESFLTMARERKAKADLGDD